MSLRVNVLPYDDAGIYAVLECIFIVCAFFRVFYFGCERVVVGRKERVGVLIGRGHDLCAGSGEVELCDRNKRGSIRGELLRAEAHVNVV